MNIDMDLEFPSDTDAPSPPLRMELDAYIEFIEFNQKTIRENGTAERVYSHRSEPVEEMFCID